MVRPQNPIRTNRSPLPTPRPPQGRLPHPLRYPGGPHTQLWEHRKSNSRRREPEILENLIDREWGEEKPKERRAEGGGRHRVSGY